MFKQLTLAAKDDIRYKWNRARIDAGHRLNTKDKLIRSIVSLLYCL